MGNVKVDFDVSRLKSGGDAAEDAQSIIIFGEVNRSGRFSYKKNASVVDMLMRAGGVTRYGSVEQIRIITKGKPQQFNLKNYLDTGNQALLPILQPGSTIFVPKETETVKTGSTIIYVMGEVFKPGAYESRCHVRLYATT